MRIAIITEGGRDIGFGHITRCSALYQAFEERGIAPEIIVSGDVQAEDLSGIGNHRIFNWTEDREKLSGFIKDTDIAIVDSYLAPSDIYRKISELTKTPVYIDDFNRLRYPRGVVINSTVYAEEVNYGDSDDILYLLGTKYMPFRRNFWDSPGKRIKKKIESIMITFGGFDNKNLTSKILGALKAKYGRIKKNVIIGKRYKNIEEIRGNGDDKTNFIYNPDAGMMKNIMLDSDIAVTSGGQTLYELLRMGTPSIGICVSENQRRNLEAWQKKGVIEYIGWYHDGDLIDKLLRSIAMISSYDERFKRSREGKRFLDGKGIERIVDTLLRISAKVPGD